MLKKLGYALLVLFALSGKANAVGDDSVYIKQLSQRFSDASASGDAKTLGTLLDDHVVFMNEDGTLASKSDIVSSAQPPAPGRTQQLVQTDWNIQMHGDIAVTSFTDQSTEHFYGQTVTERFRSTEIWLKAAGAWRMISSQTMAVPDAPKAIQLPVDQLAQYVGTYEAGPGAVIVITREGNSLASATNHSAAKKLLVEVRDVLFTPGSPRVRRVFQRNPSGAITGFYARREGHDVLYKRV